MHSYYYGCRIDRSFKLKLRVCFSKTIPTFNNFIYMNMRSKLLTKRKKDEWSRLRQISTRPTLERWATLNRLTFMNPNMINHFASQSQSANFLKIKMLAGPARHRRAAISVSLSAVLLRRMERISFWKHFFLTLNGNCEKWCNLRLNWWNSNLKLPLFKYK